MPDAKVNIASNKLAMSRALGAAFLNHQVEQLEKSVTGTGSGNWRDRRNGQTNGHVASNSPRRGPNSPGAKVAPTRKRGEAPVATTPGTRDKANQREAEQRRMTSVSPTARKRADEEAKDADVVVVDASVLVHALYKVKKWCREGREEIVIVPLEALNTLDLLKKGNSSLAQRARAASRILEAQVGTNPRIRVQRDDAFVLWDTIPVKEATTCPEWVRRVICCAKWESEHVNEELSGAAPKNPKMVLAVLSSSPNVSPQTTTMRLESDSPVPLPAPNPHHHNKHEPRSSGSLVSAWASRAGIQLLEVEPTMPGRGAVEDDDRARRRRPSGNALVERPPAVMTMMEMVAQPSKTVRLLARGEKLDPDS
ncbi:hypothetical protein CC1G_02611 [Coprinopsis cinerea okayama7|uniref:PIN domain-containing protein n=1 Tax=Coprinopsis cinerea (strain Okayama-7 / 130 / ATCC MYA-4618 / FGSC 9003) TaxID=240176 RepID=A8PBC3_COPC7|nr:hypothetical protein CC1G_02611 [Coprinopsis cinerea okayama7\|eukprot:XP_001840148.1 hypothetical protein CC1G_02611 [Coprinopsis cinerea okayama7\